MSEETPKETPIPKKVERLEAVLQKPSWTPGGKRGVVELAIRLIFVAAFVGGGGLLLASRGGDLDLEEIAGLALLGAAIAGLEIRRFFGRGDGGGSGGLMAGGAIIIAAASLLSGGAP